MYIAFLFLGVSLVAFGLLNMFSRRFDGWIHRRVGESKLDKQLFSQKEGYFIRRYIAGFQIFGIGTILIAIGLMFYFYK